MVGRGEKVPVVTGSREGEADNVDVVVSIGAREAGFADDKGLDELPLDITTEERRRGGLRGSNIRGRSTVRSRIYWWRLVLGTVGDVDEVAAELL